MILISCTNIAQLTEVENLVQIKLKLEKFNPFENKHFINLKMDNGTKPINQQIKVSDNGMVDFNFISSTKKEINFDCDYRRFNLIVSANEKVEANLNQRSVEFTQIQKIQYSQRK